MEIRARIYISIFDFPKRFSDGNKFIWDIYNIDESGKKDFSEIFLNKRHETLTNLLRKQLIKIK